MTQLKKAIVNGKITKILNTTETKLGKIHLVILRGRKAWVKDSQVKILESGYDDFLLR